MQLNPGSYLIYNQLQKCRHTPTEIRSFLLKIAASDTCVSNNTYPQAVCALRSLSIIGGIQNLIICVKMAWSEHLDCGVNIR